MPARKPDHDRPIEGTTLRVAIERLAARVARDSGGSALRALADIRAAVEMNIRREIWGGDRAAEILLTRVGEQESGSTQRQRWPEPTWRQIADDLGVSAQAAHRRYGPSR